MRLPLQAMLRNVQTVTSRILDSPLDTWAGGLYI